MKSPFDEDFSNRDFDSFGTFYTNLIYQDIVSTTGNRRDIREIVPLSIYRSSRGYSSLLILYTRGFILYYCSTYPLPHVPSSQYFLSRSPYKHFYSNAHLLLVPHSIDTPPPTNNPSSSPHPKSVPTHKSAISSPLTSSPSHNSQQSYSPSPASQPCPPTSPPFPQN